MRTSSGFSRRSDSQSAPHKGVPYEGWSVDRRRAGVSTFTGKVDLIEEVGRHYGFEHLPTTFPGVQQAPPPSDPRIARDRRVRTARARHGLLRGDHVRLHRSGGGRAIPSRRRAGRAGQPALREVRRDASEPAARTDRCGQPQPAPRTARRSALRDRHALFRDRREPRRRPGVDGPGDRRPLERRAARRRLLRHQGRRRAAGGRVAGRANRSPRPRRPIWSPAAPATSS